MGRSARLAPGGLTLALVLAAALAGLAAAGESAGRSGDRLARASKSFEVVASLALGCGLSDVSPAIAVLTCPTDEPRRPAGLTHAADADADARPGRDASTRGETDLPPPVVV